jgi:23S rRNA pseudouridine2605 synthase
MAYSRGSGGKSGGKSSRGGSAGRGGRSGGGDKPTWKKSGSSRGGDDKPAFKKHEGGDDRPRKPYGDKPAFKRRDDDDRPKKSFGDKPAFKRRDDDGRRKPYGPKDSSRSDKPAFKRRDDDDTRKPYGDKPAFKRRDDSEDRPRGGRDAGGRGFKKPFGEKPAFKRRDDGDERPRKSFGDKPFGDKPAFKRRDDDERPRRAFGDKPAFKKREDGDDRPRKTYDRPSGDKSFGERRSSSDRGGFKKPFGDRGDKPTWKRGPSTSRRSDDERSSAPRVRESDGEWKTFDNPEEASAYKKSYAPSKSHRGQDDGGDGSIRLNKYIANTGLCSRREADDMIGAGVIKVNGKIVTELGTKISAGDTVHYGDQLLRREKSVYVLLNKPKDYITTTDDPQERKTVLDLVQGAGDERIYPIGRLDRNTTGILLLTNDGDLAERLMHPKYNVEKIYQVTLDQNLRKEDFDKILEGFELEDGFIKADDLSFVGDGEDKKEVGIVLHSGRNRIVRRMFETLGYVVKHLDRVSYAGLTKKNVQRGKWRFLKPEEVGFLKMKVGGEKQKGRVTGDTGMRNAGRGKRDADKGKPVVRKKKKDPEAE